MPFFFINTPIEGLKIIQPRVFTDNRGWFIESYKETDFFLNEVKVQFVQDNHSFSKINVIRGLHFQMNPYSQGKLVRCTQGKVWDVAVDLRRNSSDFLQWYGLYLTSENQKMLYIPPGFAHGFAVVSQIAEVQYKCTSEYKPDYDGGIRFDDPLLSINWPIKQQEAIVSNKDKKLPTIQEMGEEFAL